MKLKHDGNLFNRSVKVLTSMNRVRITRINRLLDTIFSNKFDQQRFIFFTFRMFVTKSSSVTGHNQHQPTSAADISRHMQPTPDASYSW